MPRVAIVGYGAVGKGMHELFAEAVIYDEPLGLGSREEVDGCDVAFITVPTPARDSGRCDVSIVEDVISWTDSDYIVIRSTVEVGPTARLREQTGKPKDLEALTVFAKTEVRHPAVLPNAVRESNAEVRGRGVGAG